MESGTGETMTGWLQIRGDPSIRSALFDQERIANDFDHQADAVLARAERLFLERGVFHAKIHFSTGQVTLWLVSDPFRYRVHTKEEFLQTHFCAGYPRVAYAPVAVVPEAAISAVLAEFKRLRNIDPHVYLRAGSLNVVNGVVGLNFSCDGSHYLDYRALLGRAGDLCA